MSKHLISVSSSTDVDDTYTVEVDLTADEKQAVEKVFGALAKERTASFDQPRYNPRALVAFGDPIPPREEQ